jgi:hypothetical protein
MMRVKLPLQTTALEFKTPAEDSNKSKVWWDKYRKSIENKSLKPSFLGWFFFLSGIKIKNRIYSGFTTVILSFITQYEST